MAWPRSAGHDRSDVELNAQFFVQPAVLYWFQAFFGVGFHLANLDPAAVGVGKRLKLIDDLVRRTVEQVDFVGNGHGFVAQHGVKSNLYAVASGDLGVASCVLSVRL